MTRFADDLFNDLMREHGSALERVNVPKARQRHLTARPVLATAGAGGLAVAAAAGTLVATSAGSPAYAMTTHPNGTVTLAKNATKSLSQLGTRPSQYPLVQMPDLPVNQDACQKSTFHMSYSGTAVKS